MKSKKQKQPKTPSKLIKKEIELVVFTRDGGWGLGELEEGGQKAQTSSYKINKYQEYNAQNA